MSDTVVRAVTLPVAEPVGSSWEQLNKSLAACFRLSTDAANWCVWSLFRRDVPGQEKTPQTVKPRGKNNPTGFYEYGEYLAAHPGCTAKDGAWSGCAQSLNICLRYAAKKYRDERFDVMVRHDSRLLTIRYPYPFPVDADAWTPSYIDGGFPAVTLGLPGMGRITLRLKRRADCGRQLAMFRQLRDGTAKRGEAALCRNGKGDLMLKLVGHFPRVERARDTHAAFIHTDPNALIVCEIDGRSPWLLNADHLKRQQAAHRSYRQRASEDGKREKRMDERQRYFLNKSRELRCEKNNNRLNTAIHQLTAQIARFCERQKVGTVAYDDSVKTYIPDGFPWFVFKEKLRYKLDELDIEWIDGTTEGVRAECGGPFPSLTTEDRQQWLLKARALLTAARRVSAKKSRAPGKSHPAVSTTAAT